MNTSHSVLPVFVICWTKGGMEQIPDNYFVRQGSSWADRHSVTERQTATITSMGNVRAARHPQTHAFDWCWKKLMQKQNMQTLL